RLNEGKGSIAEVEQLLWDTALRIEDGRMSLAERELRRLQQQLQDALAKNAPDDEIDRLIRELQQALDRYLQALAENMARNPDQAEQPLDRSFRAQQQAQQGRTGQRGQQGGEAQDGSPEMGDAAGQQDGLRRMLGDMMRRLGDGFGEIPDPLGRAERAMRDATDALQR